MATVWARRDGWSGASVLDRVDVAGITPALTMRSRVEGNAQPLQANRAQAFIGSYVLGMGFVLSPEEADVMLDNDPRNAEVVRPYLIGEDLNQRPDGSPSRWVIDFRDWPEERAREYTSRSHASSVSFSLSATSNNWRAARERWWQFE